MLRLPLVLLLAALSPAAFSAEEAADAGSFHGTAGLQLYSLRDEFKHKGVADTLDFVSKLGIREVETAGTYGSPADEFRKALEEHGLTPVSGHFQYDALAADLPTAIREARALGLKYAVCPWITHGIGEFSENDAHRAARDFNWWGAEFKKEGIQFGYHCHGYEFQPRTDGTTLFDILMAETKPDLVVFEMDVFWVAHPGQDPVKLLRKYGRRWQLMHLKDLRKGVRTGVYTGHTSLEDDVPLGTGQIDWPSVLRAAAQAGIKHYFIEDESPTAVEAIPKSLSYLQTLQAPK